MSNFGKRRHFKEKKKAVISAESLVILTLDGCEILAQIFDLQVKSSFLPLYTRLHLKYIIKAYLLLKSKLIQKLSDLQQALL